MSDIIWKHALGAAILLLALWFALMAIHFGLTEVTQEHLTHGHEHHTWLEWARTTAENLQSEVWQIALAAWVFKRFLWTGSPESKDTA